jgi:hypothetical protein
MDFCGTIDNDLMALYGDEEIFYATDHGIAVAELSPRTKQHGVGDRMTEAFVADYARRKMTKAHLRNFRHGFRIKGRPVRPDPIAMELLSRLGR